MPFDFDAENDCVRIRLGDGDVGVKLNIECEEEKKGIKLSDLGQECKVGEDLTHCDIGESKDRYVEISGSYHGLRILSMALLNVLLFKDDKGDYKLDFICWCVGCTRNNSSVRIIDTGLFTICEECLSNLYIMAQEVKNRPPSG